MLFKQNLESAKGSSMTEDGVIKISSQENGKIKGKNERGRNGLVRTHLLMLFPPV